ncbi:MAG: ribonuclease R family protein [Planctomycetota bacterium]
MSDTPSQGQGPGHSDIRQRILERIDATTQPPASTSELIRATGLDAGETSDDPRRVDDLLHTMTLQGLIVTRADGTWRRCTAQDVIGRVSTATRDSFALVIPTDRSKPLIKVGRRHLLDARHGDLVHAMLMDVPATAAVDENDDNESDNDNESGDSNDNQSTARRSHGRGRRGREKRAEESSDELPPLAWARIVRVLERRPDTLIGIINATGRYPEVRILQRDAPKRLRITGGIPGGGLDGAIVRVKIEKDQDRRGHELCRVLEILGSAFSPEDDELVAIAEAGLRMEYDPAAAAEARVVIRLAADDVRAPHPGRRDHTHLHVITIDPADAKDHDDAMSIEVHADGRTTLGVHIADVSHYVPPGSALDAEAALRGCTVYLPAKTLHMLPLGLAGEVCSLSEGVRRFAKTVFITYDANGNILERELVRSVIVNGARLTYVEAYDIMLGRMPADQLARFPAWTPEVIQQIGTLSQLLKRRRREAGSFQLNIPRPHLTVDAKGRFVKVEPEHEDDSNTIVEECMLAANQAVAHFLDEHGLPLLARVHPDPSPTDIDSFAAFLAQLGFELPGGEFSPKTVQKLLDDIAEKEGGPAVHLALLKSMQRAVYADHIDTHYALQFDHYLHFTSPIRRYPDTLVHQVCDAWLDTGREFRWTAKGGVSDKTKGLPEATQSRFELITPVAANHCTERSIRADNAEQRVVKTRILREIAARHIGKELLATVTGGTRGGIFCQLDGWLIDGFIGRYGLAYDRLEPAGSFSWIAWYGVKTHTFRVGSRLKVRIVSADPGLGELSLELAEAPWLGTPVTGGKRRGGRQQSARQPAQGGPRRGHGWAGKGKPSKGPGGGGGKKKRSGGGKGHRKGRRRGDA